MATISGKWRLIWCWENDDASDGAQGVTEIDFGTGGSTASFTLTGQVGILVASKASAWLDTGTASTDGHTAAQHAALAQAVRIAVGAPSAGNGFTVTVTPSPAPAVIAYKVTGADIAGGTAIIFPLPFIPLGAVGQVMGGGPVNGCVSCDGTTAQVTLAIVDPATSVTPFLANDVVVITLA